MKKKLLIIGSGGREHALAWKLAQSERVEKIFVAPGNAGTTSENKCENIDLNTIDEFKIFALKNQIDLTIVGPEAFLVDGIADEFNSVGLNIFAPNKKAAQLEGSKAFAKHFMEKYGIKTAKYKSFKSISYALEYLNVVDYPVVIKASGLAAGKGVVICENQMEASIELQEMMSNQKFGSAGSEVVIEEFLQGFEASILSLCDGKTILPFLSAKDHKKIGEGETGLNTGGMGVVSPNPLFTDTHFNQFNTDILAPTLQGLQEENIDFIGVIFFGLMINENGVYLLEYNTRFGDPETQAVLPLLENDLLELMELSIEKRLSEATLKWKKAHSCCVVAVSGGYPEAYEKGKSITIEAINSSKIFMAGATLKNKEVKTTGGRVLSIVSQAESLEKATEIAYDDIKKVSFDKMVYRKDIGK